jgi:hypothetical protein
MIGFLRDFNKALKLFHRSRIGKNSSSDAPRKRGQIGRSASSRRNTFMSFASKVFQLLAPRQYAHKTNYIREASSPSSPLFSISAPMDSTDAPASIRLRMS